jgi:hypothetical protein
MLLRRGIRAAMLVNDDRLYRLRSVCDPAGILGVQKAIAITRRHDEVEQQSVRVCAEASGSEQQKKERFHEG